MPWYLFEQGRRQHHHSPKCLHLISAFGDSTTIEKPLILLDISYSSGHISIGRQPVQRNKSVKVSCPGGTTSTNFHELPRTSRVHLEFECTADMLQNPTWQHLRLHSHLHFQKHPVFFASKKYTLICSICLSHPLLLQNGSKW